MQIIVANKEEYFNFQEGVSSEMQTFNLQDNTVNYVICEVIFGNSKKDFSVINDTVYNLLNKQFIKGEYVTSEELQEIDKILLKLNEEEIEILKACMEEKRFSIKNLSELKDCILNINCYQLLKLHTLEEVGKLIVEQVSSYKVNDEMKNFVNYNSIAEEFFKEIGVKTTFCFNGLLIDTTEMIDNELIKDKVGQNKILKLKLANQKEFETKENYKKVTIYLPEDEKIIGKKLQRINENYDKSTVKDYQIIEVGLVNFEDEDLRIGFDNFIEELMLINTTTTTLFKDICNLNANIAKFNGEEIQKLLALIELEKEKVSSVNDLISLMDSLKDYNLIQEIENLYDMGVYLVDETDHYNEVNKLQPYIDYRRLAQDYIDKGQTYAGKFTYYGCLIHNKENEKQEDEEFE